MNHFLFGDIEKSDRPDHRENEDRASNQIVTKTMHLVPTQKKLTEALDTLLSHFRTVVVRGESGTGKHVAIRNYFLEHDITPIEFDFYEQIKTIGCRRVNAQDLIVFYDELLQKVGQYPVGRRCIYMRHYDKISDILSDHYSENRYLVGYILQRWLAKLSETAPDVRVIITTSSFVSTDSTYTWNYDYELRPEDNEALIYADETLCSDIQKSILKLCKVASLGVILHCLRYAKCMYYKSEWPRTWHSYHTRENAVFDIENEPMENISAIHTECNIKKSKVIYEDGKKFMEYYYFARNRFYPSTVNVEKDVIEPVQNTDLIGLEHILREIEIAVLNPLSLGDPDVPIKKGIVLYGPAGVGKSSVGRWLAHKLNGKLFTIGNEAGICGGAFSDVLEQIMALAYKNAPAVVFIDDIDVICGKDDSYRALLTTLDGLSNKKRVNVCVMVTCMDLGKIPAPLIRGGRLEMALRLSKPSYETIKTMLSVGCAKIIRVLKNTNARNLAEITTELSGKEIIRNLAMRLQGSNCADVTRCIDDVLRHLISISEKVNVYDLFCNYIERVHEQYKRCGRSDETIEPLESRTTSYHM